MRRRTVTWLMAVMGLAVSRAATGDFGDPIHFGDPIRGLSAAQLRRFNTGQEAFEEVETPEDGLGPVFNETSCARCHNVGGTGGGSETLETRFGRDVHGVFDPLEALGGSLIQTTGIGSTACGDIDGELVPPEANRVARRRTTPLFGLGLVDAVPDDAFVSLAEKQANLHPETAGRPNYVTDLATGATVVGKFGWKAQVPNLLQFSADAYLNEMGITTPMFPAENCPQGDCSLLECDPVPGEPLKLDDDNEDVELFHDFMRFLAPPPAQIDVGTGGNFTRRRSPDTTYQGSRLFEQIGCANCHVGPLTTGASDVAALQFRTFRPYSDFLLHYMASLGDGIEQGQASGGEMRTAPLWGLRLLTKFLHDGRASTIQEAILAHDGQGAAARDRFRGLLDEEKKKLLAFLRRL
jgi:CxxC motif-containing protein (DUF1111 family)